MSYVDEEIEKQIQRTKDADSSPKNVALYFSLLLEFKDLVENTMVLLEQYYKEYLSTKQTDIL